MPAQSYDFHARLASSTAQDFWKTLEDYVGVWLLGVIIIIYLLTLP